MLYFELEGDNRLIVRPSGTEPKMKVYALVKGNDLAEAEALADRCAQSARDILIKI